MTKQRYPTDLTDTRWKLIKPNLGPHPKGLKRRVRMRRIINALLYVLVSGAQRRLLPGEFPKWQLVYYYFRRLHRLGVWKRLYHVLRALWRYQNGRHKHPTAGYMDSQSVQRSLVAGERGWDNAKKLRGRKRHLLVDTQGAPWKWWSRRPTSRSLRAHASSGKSWGGGVA